MPSRNKLTRAKWLTCSNPHQMMGALRGKVSNRKLSLLSCACCRLLLTRTKEEILIAEIEQACDATGLERAFEGSAETAVELWTTYLAARVGRGEEFEDPEERVAEALTFLTEPSGFDPEKAANYAATASRHHEIAICALIRCIAGNSFLPVAFDPRWSTSTVVVLAEGIYEERRFADLPILADALEEAECSNPTILEHCRAEQEHARGCWVVDAVLGRK